MLSSTRPASPVLPPAAAIDLPLISDAELAQHRSQGDCWVAFEGLVRDASHFRHPGGAAMLFEPDDRDITAAFRAAHAPGVARTLERLPLVGRHERKAPAVFAPAASTLGASSPRPVAESTSALHASFRAFVESDAFPCLGGKIALSRGAYGFAEYPEPLGSEKNGPLLARHLSDWVTQQTQLWSEGQHFTTFVATFPKAPVEGGERRFEELLMKQLQSLHDHDRAPWPADAPSNPHDSRFRFAFGGRVYFPVGLFPDASRKGRVFSHPTVVFNAQEQFAHLRETEQFEPLRRGIRRRDLRIAGSVNPNLMPGYAGSALAEASGMDHSQDAEPFRPPLQIQARPEERAGWAA